MLSRPGLHMCVAMAICKWDGHVMQNLRSDWPVGMGGTLGTAECLSTLQELQVANGNPRNIHRNFLYLLPGVCFKSCIHSLPLTPLSVPHYLLACSYPHPSLSPSPPPPGLLVPPPLVISSSSAHATNVLMYHITTHILIFWFKLTPFKYLHYVKKHISKPCYIRSRSAGSYQWIQP